MLKDEKITTSQNQMFLFVIVLLSLAVNFTFLTYRGFWVNEFITLRSLELPYGELFFSRMESNHSPFYFLFLKFWGNMFGMSEASLRFPSAVFGVLAAIYLFKLLRGCVGERWAFLGALFAVFHRNILFPAHDIRMYIILIWAAIASIYYFLSYLHNPKKSTILKYFIVSLIGVSVQILFVQVTITQLIYIALHNKEFRGRISKLVALVASPVIVFSPIIYLWGTRQQYVTKEMDFGNIKMARFLRTVGKVFWGDYEDFKYYHLIVGIGWILFIIIVVRLIRKYLELKRTTRSNEKAKGEFEILEISGLLFLIVMTSILISSVVTQNVVGRIRYYSACVGVAPVLFVLGVRSIRSQRFRRLAIVLGMIVLMCFGGGYLFSRGAQVREAIRHIDDNSEPGDVLVFCHGSSTKNAFAYYGLQDIQPISINRKIRDENEIMNIVRGVCDGNDRLWLFLYHEKRSPILKVIDENKQMFARIGRMKMMGDVRIGLYEIKN